jgi:hypothetical protein
LHVAWQWPSAGLWTQIDLERIDAWTALNRRLLLYRTGIDRGKRKGAGTKETLHHSTPAAGNARLRDTGRTDRCGSNAKWRGRIHAMILLRKW